MIMSLPCAVGCGSATDDPGPQGPGVLPQEIDAIVEEYCRDCHSDPVMQYAPMPLVDWDDFQAPRRQDPSEAVFEIVLRRINDERYPMPPVSQPQLPDAEHDALDAWLSAGAPSAE